tara:strand:- start:1134 stop:1424 length:291 start_codon:yes stop_codon:yes gene_type:complete
MGSMSNLHDDADSEVSAVEVVNLVTRQYRTINAMIQAHSQTEENSVPGEMLKFAILSHLFSHLRRHRNETEFLRPIQTEMANSWNRLASMTYEDSP